jgi:hypothetical protein
VRAEGKMTDTLPIILETNRIYLRRQEMDDLDNLYALYCDPEITRYILDAPKNYEEAREAKFPKWVLVLSIWRQYDGN